MSAFKRRLYEILEVSSAEDRTSRLFDQLLMLLIALNVAAVILETMEGFYEAYRPWFDGFELFTVAVFSLEYAARMTVCTVDERYARPLWGRLRYSLTPMALIDLLAILPFWLTLTAVDMRIVRLLRIFRILRIAKLARYSKAVQTLGRVFVTSRHELTVTFLVMLVLLLLASSFMYFAEHEAQPEAFSSIPAAMWWAVATLTTVGYGDVYPVTTLGRLIAAVIAVFGIGMFALPTGVLGSAFMEEMQRQREEGERRCPHCGKPPEE